MKRPFRAGSKIPERVLPLRPQTAKRRPQQEIIVEEVTLSKPQTKRPPTNIRNKAPVKVALANANKALEPTPTPRRIGPAAAVRPTTAQPSRRGGRVPANQEVTEKVKEIDYVKQTEKLREEISKEFGINVHEKDVEQPWLDEMTALKERLNENVYQSSLIDDSPLSIMESVYNNILESTTSLDNPFNSANKIVDQTFAEFEKRMEEEKKLFQERSKILQELGKQLMMHPASEYTADTTPEVLDDLPKKQPIIIQTKARPSTARAPAREFR